MLDDGLRFERVDYYRRAEEASKKGCFGTGTICISPSCILMKWHFQRD